MGRKKNENSLSRSKLQSNNSINESNTNNEKLPFELNDLLKKKWKVFRVSPLNDFNENDLKLYQKALNLELGYRKKIGSDIFYFSTFKTVKKLKLKEDFVEAIEVNVTNNQNKKCYLGYFFSRLSEEGCSSGFTTNSILLVNSNSFEVNEVHYGLSKLFDCDIQPVTFLLNNLITFFVKLLENPQEKTAASEDLITLTYKIPGCNKEDNLDVTLLLEDTTIVLALTIDRLRESVSEISNMEIMSEFYTRLLNHIYKVYKLDLMMTELNKIAFPHASFSADGLIKILSDISLKLILNILLHISHLNLLSYY